MKRVPAIALALVILPAAPILADEARIPIFQPTTITQPGYYILTRDLSPASGTAITIQSDGVTVDLNGRAINNAPSQAAIVVNGGFQNITIRNGRLSGGNFGVNAAASAPATVNLRVERVEIRNTVGGVLVIGAGIVQVISCRITDSGVDGMFIEAQTGGTAFTGQFIDNVIDNVGRFGIDVGGGRGVEVRGNVITRFGTTTPRVFGLILGSGFGGGGGNMVEGNVVRGSDDDIGIVVDVPNNLITNNVVSDMGSTGIGILIEADGNRIVGNVVSTSNVGISALGGHNHFERNHVEANRSDGLSISTGYNLVDSNVSEFNGAFGLNFVSGPGNAYRNNMLRHNTSGAVSGTATDAGGNIL